MTKTLTITRPDDWHLHLRDGDMLRAVLPETAGDFGRAIIMPNLIPPVVTALDAAAYRDRIIAAMPQGANFTPHMTLYLTETTDPNDVAAAFDDDLIRAVKYYPAGATTNSDSGVRDINNVMHILEKMSEIGLNLCIHGEVTNPDIDIFDREAVFIETILDPLRTRLPDLKITSEHNHILAGGIRPHYYCLPGAKREEHRLALRAAATSGDPRFFLGTDSAPHTDPNKLQPCGCAGCFTASNTMSCLAHVFEEEGALDKLENYTSHLTPDLICFGA